MSQPSPLPQPVNTSPAATSALYKTPLESYRLTVEADPSAGRRRTLILGAALGMVIALILSWANLTLGRSLAGLPIGLGRLAHLVEDQGWSFANLLAALEYAHFGLLLGFMATVTAFGATRRSARLPREILIFHRRQSPAVALNGIALSCAGLLAGQFLSGSGLGLIAVPVEIISLSILATSVWRAAVPEARISMSVFLDGNAGWGNRIILSGGNLRRINRLTVGKTALISAAARDVGGLEMISGARTLVLNYVDDDGVRRRLSLPGLASDPEIGVLASFLNTRFKLGLSPQGLDRATAMNRFPAEMAFVIGD